MTAASRWLSLFFSLGMHTLLLGGILFLFNEAPDTTEKVFRVALAEFAPAPAPAPALVPAPAPPSLATVAPPAPQVQKTDAQANKSEKAKPAIKKISPKKSNKSVAKEQAAPLPPALTPVAPAGPQPRTIGGLSVYESNVLDQRPSITRRVEPEYPTKARRMNVQGSVNVRLIVDSSGQPRNCEVVRATPDGHFEESAIKAAQSMRFAPGRLKGQPVSTLVELPFIFKLR
ncbi:MAG: energy transducer TonB [Desulfovibrio sp.]|nr:energy transducer TonB [Desulfovibrio sp.]